MVATNVSGVARATAARLFECAEPPWPGLLVEYLYMARQLSRVFQLDSK
jgi:hypothetical protein